MDKWQIDVKSVSERKTGLMHFQTVLQQARTEPYHHYYQLCRSFVSVHTHTAVGEGGGGCRHARSSLANTGRLAAGISDRYSAKSAGRRGEPHSYTYLYGWSIARSRLWALSMHSWIRPSILIPTKFTPLISTLFRIVDRRSRNTSNMFLFIFSLIFFILICS